MKDVAVSDMEEALECVPQDIRDWLESNPAFKTIVIAASVGIANMMETEIERRVKEKLEGGNGNEPLRCGPPYRQKVHGGKLPQKQRRDGYQDDQGRQGTAEGQGAPEGIQAQGQAQGQEHQKREVQV